MKLIDIALKDMLRSFRNLFSIVFMFGIPLLVTAMFYLMFGSMPADDQGFALAQTQVVIANLDEGSQDFEGAFMNLPAGSEANSLGEMIVAVLQAEQFTDLLQVTLVEDAEAARLAVDSQEAGVAIIIPIDFSRAFSAPEGETTLILYQDPSLTIGSAIVRSVLSQLIDNISGARIAMQVALADDPAPDQMMAMQIVQQYLQAISPAYEPANLLEVRSPANAEVEEPSLVMQIVGPIMGGSMIIYAFMTGVSAAQTILKEDEEGTLPRLFTTPTPQATILAGKFLAVLLTVFVQVVVLLILGKVIFGIYWGDFISVMLVALGTILSASALGVFIISLVKNTRQGGIIMGAVLTPMSMLAMIRIFMWSTPPGGPLETASLFVPQGWVARAMFQAMDSMPLGEVWVTSLVLLAWSVVFFVIAIWRFKKRYA